MTLSWQRKVVIFSVTADQEAKLLPPAGNQSFVVLKMFPVKIEGVVIR